LCNSRKAALSPAEPAVTLLDPADSLRPARVILASVRSESYLHAGDTLAELGRRVPVSLAGEGARATAITDLGCEVLKRDPVADAARLA
jgi:hypothetical protein